ncbi:hypothetical protein ACTNEF_01425 [Bariatricus sp. HCP28S3_E4]|uniref:hypothetical protein n=1 Tax=unclassified Bariatricus TaxID=2677046 RepID=UPI003F8CC9BC
MLVVAGVLRWPAGGSRTSRNLSRGADQAPFSPCTLAVWIDGMEKPGVGYQTKRYIL